MKAYELLFFVAPSIDEESRLAVMKRIEITITADKGVVDNVDNWGKRKLAYEVNGLTDGDYTLIDFHANPENIAELDRVLRITDAVERFMIVKRTDRDEYAIISIARRAISKEKEIKRQMGYRFAR